MSRAHRTALAAVAALAALSCGACSPPDEIVLAVPTDMALPKDWKALQIQVFKGGTPRFSASYERLGESDAATHLPATIGFVSAGGGGDTIRVKVSARVEDELSAVRILREAVTTIPENRVALLTLPLYFLCDDSGRAEADGSVVNKHCKEGETCVAGACVSSEIDSSTLPDYAARDVYGGGSGSGNGACFDVTACFQGAAPAELDAEACVIEVEDGATRNVALQLPAEGDGICDDDRCLVALDADSADGFQVKEDGRIQLPASVCGPSVSGKITGVVTAPVTETCSRKTVGLPTCGPWSASGSKSTAP